LAVLGILQVAVVQIYETIISGECGQFDWPKTSPWEVDQAGHANLHKDQGIYELRQEGQMDLESMTLQDI